MSTLAAAVGTFTTAPTWTREKRPARTLLTDPTIMTMQLKEPLIFEVPQPVPEWFTETLQALEHLSTLRDNWDSYGARPIKDDTIFMALDLAYRTLPYDADAPIVVPTSDSGVQLEWSDDGYELEMRVRPNGEISAFRFDEGAGEGDTIESITLADLQPLFDFLNQQ